MNVLFVDDDSDLLETYLDEVREALPDLKVTGVESGPAALAHLADNHVDLVFTDIMMPKMNGLELTQKIREQQPELRVIAITGYSREHSVESVRAAGVYQVLEKPINYDHLIEVIKNVQSP